MSTTSINSSTISTAYAASYSFIFFQYYFIIVKLTDDNYLLWFHQIEAFLYGQNYLQFVDGSYLYPENEPDKSIWLQADKIVSLISATPSESILATVIRCTSSAKLWSLIQENYSQQSIANISFCKKRITTRSITEYRQEAKYISNALAAIGEACFQQRTSNFIA